MPLDTLYIVAGRPVDPELLGVVVSRSAKRDRLVFSAPCCGIACRQAPHDHRLDVITPLEELESDGVGLPSREDIHLEASGLKILREEPLENWSSYLSGSKRTD